jgi:omega-amidase
MHQGQTMSIELLIEGDGPLWQIYVATCSPARDTSAGYIAWGHSTVVGPFGEILATTEHEETTIIADIDYTEIDKRRLNMPMESQRRGDLYSLLDVTCLASHNTF